MASKYKKNKVKFKWSKELIILLVVLVAILITTIVLNIPSAKAKSTKQFNDAIVEYNTANSTSYTTLSEDNVFEKISHEKLVKKIAGKDYVYVLYSSLNNATILEQLSSINAKAKDEEIKTVYLYSSEWVEKTEDLETENFKTKKAGIEEDINKSKGKDVDDFSVESYPAILVFHDGEMIFNSQTYDESDEYNWSMYIQKALLISKEQK